MLLILDCNVWLDWLLFDDSGITNLKLQINAGKITVIGTATMRDELLDVLHRDTVGKKFIARSRFGSVEAMMIEYDSVVQPQAKPTVNALQVPQCKDKDDQMFVDLAVAMKATILSKDRHLLALAQKLKKQCGVQVIHPARFTL